MSSCSKTDSDRSPAEPAVRRCRPLLGTFVEITASGPMTEALRRAVDAAFAAVETVHRLMSFHDPASDVSELNRLAARRAVRVHPWTHEVLSAARALAIESAGAFDITIAPLLQRWRYLPQRARDGRGLARGGPLDIELRPARGVRFRRPLQIDLGGIAKGFAVDRAAEILQAGGAVSGCVNAGGDLRVFGQPPRYVHVRHPALPGHFLGLTAVTDAALATSASYFTRKRWRGRWICPLVDPRRRRACTDAASISVRAPTCLLADALTKVVRVDPRGAPALLAQFRAAAFVVSALGEISQLRDET